jgi:hypothetical protein
VDAAGLKNVYFFIHLVILVIKTSAGHGLLPSHFALLPIRNLSFIRVATEEKTLKILGMRKRRKENN